MIRLITFAAAAALVALPASAQAPAARSIRISTAGKSVGEIRMEVFRAAKTLCADGSGAGLPIDEMRACLSNTMRATLAQSADPSLRMASR
jgi:hypothetical protein